MSTTPASDADIDEVLRHHSVATTSRAWRTTDEMRRYEAIQDRLGIQDFGQSLGIFAGFVGVLLVGIAGATHFGTRTPENSPAELGIVGGVATLFAVAVYVYFARRQTKTRPLLAEVAPIVTTSAAAWAYSQAHHNGGVSEQADALRFALAAKPVTEHANMPEHDELLRLGLASSR